MARCSGMKLRSLPAMALALGLAMSAATIPNADAKGGGGGMGGGADMGGGHAGEMPAISNAGGQLTDSAAAERSGDQGNANSANKENSATASTTATSTRTNHDRITAALGALNASNASATARTHASSRSRVAKIAAYDKAMLTALAMPGATPPQVVARNAAIADARATLLTAASNKPLTASVIATVDRRLGLPASDPTLGLAP
jgi:hypothetical protein